MCRLLCWTTLILTECLLPQDPKTRFIPHRPVTYLAVTTVWSLYCSISQLFVIFIAFAQLDLLLVRLLSDIAANFVTTNMYLHGKQYNPEMYKHMMANPDSMMMVTTCLTKHEDEMTMMMMDHEGQLSTPPPPTAASLASSQRLAAPHAAEDCRTSCVGEDDEDDNSRLLLPTQPPIALFSSSA